MNRIRNIFFCVFALTIGGASFLRAAEITIDPSGGGDYTMLEAALTSANYGAWAVDGGTSDTIYLVDGLHVIDGSASGADKRARVPSTLDGILTIRNAPGANPVIVLSPLAARGIQVTGGTVIIEGLTFMGQKNQGTGTARYAISVDGLNAGSSADLTVRDVVITANGGNDTPIMDFSVLRPTYGLIYRGIGYGDDPLAGPVQLKVENSVIAFTEDHGIISFNDLPAGSAVQIKNTLICNCGATEDGIGYRVMEQSTSGVTLTIEDCAFFRNNKNKALIVTKNSAASTNLNVAIRSSIFANESITFSYPSGAYEIDSCTYAAVTILDGLVFSNCSSTIKPTVSIQDTIFTGLDPTGSATRFGPVSLDPPFVTLTLGKNAVYGLDHPYRSDAAQTVKDTWDASTFLTSDPQFRATALGSSEVGIRQWDSTTNDLFDIQNEEYLGQATAGGDLTGGAEVYVFVNSVRDWSLFQ